MNKIDYLIQKYSTGNKVAKPERIAQSAVDFFDSAREYWNRATSGNFLDRLWTRWTADDQSAAKTFDEAYSNARKNGYKTFIWNNKHYSTDYSGEHHKKYEEDVKSGKAAAWEKNYPGFTNPELRKAKQEELDTYGITNEQTQNKTIKHNVLHRIPAQGYDVSTAISSILGEHTKYSSYNSPEEYYDAMRKKYPEFADFPFEDYYTEFMLSNGNLTGIYDMTNNVSNEYFENKNISLKDQEKFMSDLLPGYKTNDIPYHKEEYDFLLGYPQNTIKVSKYKTGSLPYYYTLNELENSIPFPTTNYVKPFNDRLNRLDSLNNERLKIENPILEKIKKENERIDWNIAHNTFNKSGDWKRINGELNEMYNKENEFIDYLYNNISALNDIGVDLSEGIPYIYDYTKFNHSQNELKTKLLNSGYLPIYEFPIENFGEGNYLAAMESSTNDYYSANDKYFDYRKYSNMISKLQNWSNKLNKKPHERETPTLILNNYLMDTYRLGAHTVGIPLDQSYMSIWDKFDIDPFASGNSKPLLEIGKPFEYYTRFYKDSEPNIDSLYNNFQWKKQ